LFNSYCSSKRCLECAVGLNIIKESHVSYQSNRLS
jgi:hypothetical protein